MALVIGREAEKKGDASPVLHRATIFIRFTSTSSGRSVTSRRNKRRKKEKKEEKRETTTQVNS